MHEVEEKAWRPGRDSKQREHPSQGMWRGNRRGGQRRAHRLALLDVRLVGGRRGVAAGGGVVPDCLAGGIRTFFSRQEGLRGTTGPCWGFGKGIVMAVWRANRWRVGVSRET